MTDIKILLADDQNLIAQSLKDSLNAAPGITVVKTVNSGSDLMQAIKIKGLNLVILDIELVKSSELNLNVESGLDFAVKIRKANPDLKIMFLTMFANKKKYICRAIAPPIEANGICSKDVSSEDLIGMIRKICIQNERTYSADVIQVIPKCAEKANLSKREQHVACLSAKGFTVAEISKKLFIASGTVERHRTHIYQKTDTNNLAELTGYVISEKICEGLSFDN